MRKRFRKELIVVMGELSAISEYYFLLLSRLDRAFAVLFVMNFVWRFQRRFTFKKEPIVGKCNWLHNYSSVLSGSDCL